MPLAVLALTAGAFGIGTTEFLIMGLLLQVAADMHVSVSAAGLLISGYALGVFVGAPILTLGTRKMPRKAVLLALMAIFTLGNAACALAPNYELLMAARILTSLAHGTFFGVGSVVATSLVPEDKKASAIATMFIGLTVATLLGVPFGAWFGLMLGWRAAFWAVAAIGVIAFIVLAALVPGHVGANDKPAQLREELAVLGRPQVLLGLAMTVFGFGGLFAVFTYVQPILTRLTGFSDAAVSPILLVFGAGLAIGNVAGGRLADKGVARALLVSLGGLAAVLVALAAVISIKALVVVLLFVLGIAAFATVAPLQLRVLEAAGVEGRTLASSLNIAAFNLGNALGAWAGGVTIDRGLGLGVLPLVAAVITAIGLLLALWSLRLDRPAVLATQCPAE
ncbi:MULTISPECIES: MFS transporter [Bradyrhizobium]|jgi:DHA1 family inner membrane transport protein|uniref:MFS transporter n=1 Tax=Bradyrhizobium TaxID=374 RepID=UPI000415BD08|nr:MULTISPECIES: MFS transporter [Bradyrhizobium]AUC94138.1 MFS transporter [Bradyrhizobium sp. SK17]KIU51416.1 arabinose transporter permease [Bradyrhizobium elkanii]MBK5655828.1 MFS transporter [Rhizobium sp.]OCX31538.1 arabinose transporter permease [Bradyrhizobium sp. UASWS1016]